jgi:hypothetical protein
MLDTTPSPIVSVITNSLPPYPPLLTRHQCNTRQYSGDYLEKSTRLHTSLHFTDKKILILKSPYNVKSIPVQTDESTFMDENYTHG